MEFEALYRREVGAIYAFLVRLGAPHAELADLTHDVFTTAIHKWSTYDAQRPVRPWLMGIAWRLMSDYRARKRPEVVDEVPDTADEGANLDASLDARDAQRLLLRALAHLDETKRVAFVMHELQGLSVAQVSEAMDAPAQTTYSRLRTAREELAVAVRRIQREAP